jgi:F0F1-type ATP synthase assembly protein I
MLQEQIKKSNEENVSDNIRIAKNYSKIIHVLVIISKLIIIASGLISFSGTRFSHWSISFSSGSLNFLATSILSYTAFLTAERKRITKSLNTKLVTLGIEEKLLISENDSDKSS